VGLLGVLLSGCGTHSPGADAVQQQFIAAIRANDQPALQRLVAPTALYTVADIPTNIYNATADPNYKLGYKPTGPFQRVEIQPATPAGRRWSSRASGTGKQQSIASTRRSLRSRMVGR